MSDPPRSPRDQDGQICSNSGYRQWTDAQNSQMMSSLQQSHTIHRSNPYMLPGENSMPAQQAVIDPSGSVQSQQTDPRSIKDGSKQRRTSRQYTPEETAAIAAAWVEHKPVLEGKCSSAPDKRKAWLMFQEMAYALAPSLQQDFLRLEQLKSKVTSINGLYQKAIESMDCSGGAESDFRDTKAFKILEGSDLARDPLIRPQGLLDRTKPDGKFVVLLWQTYTLHVCHSRAY